MINRKQTYRVSFKGVHRVDKVTAIKLLRRLSDLGLKDAKDTVEATMGRTDFDDDGHLIDGLLPALHGSTCIELLDEHHSEHWGDHATPGSLRELGAQVVLVGEKAVQKDADVCNLLRGALIAACQAHNDELTGDILALINKHSI
jgi:hypothetical protein